VFFDACINFLIVAFAIFLLVKAVNRLKREEKAPAAAPTTKACPQCLMEVPVAARKCGHCTSQLAAA
jgi:large conductance mechanosensitive channel